MRCTALSCVHVYVYVYVYVYVCVYVYVSFLLHVLLCVPKVVYSTKCLKHDNNKRQNKS